MWSWLKSLFAPEPVPQLSGPRCPSPVQGGETLRALDWRKQESYPESEHFFTTEPDADCVEPDQGPVLGIDLGTTHSVMAVVRAGKVEVIPNQEGEILTPSVVSFTESGEVLVGARARQRAVNDPQRTVYSIKRLLGRAGEAWRTLASRLVYDIVAGPRETPRVLIDGRPYSPVEILALLLGKLKDAAETHLGHPTRRAIVTVPVFFTDAQRQAVLEAAERAGFDVDWVLKDPGTGRKIRQRMRIISEPTAAALALAHGQNIRKLAVLHMGGGTFDITLLEIGGGVLEVKAVGGDAALGGDDFDQALVDHWLEQVPPAARERLRQDRVARQRLRLAAEQAKRDISQNSEVSVDLPWLCQEEGGLHVTVTRTKLERLVEPLIDRCRRLVLDTLRDAGFRAEAVDEVLVIGGMTRMPGLRQLFCDLFTRAVHRAAAFDEVVAMGAAIQGQQLLLGSRSQLLVLDVTPLTLGLETPTGEFVAMISRNATIPTVKTQVFTVAADYQPGVSIRLFQEEGRQAGRRQFLGQLDLEGLNAPRTQTKIDVTFDVDANGILRVRARDQASGKEKSMCVTPRPPAELMPARHQVRQCIGDIERLLEDRGRHFSPADQEPLRRLIERVRVLARSEDMGVILQALHQLERARDALIAYLDGRLRADSPSEFFQKHLPKKSDWDPCLEI